MLSVRYDLKKTFPEAHFFHDVVCGSLLDRAHKFPPGKLAEAFHGLFSDRANVREIEIFMIKWGIAHLFVLLDRPDDLMALFRPDDLPRRRRPRVSVHARLREGRYDRMDVSVTDVSPRILTEGSFYVPWEWGTWTQFVGQGSLPGRTQLPERLLNKTPLEVAELFSRTECAAVLEAIQRLEARDERAEAVRQRRREAQAARDEQAVLARQLREEQLEEFERGQRLVDERELEQIRVDAIRRRIRLNPVFDADIEEDEGETTSDEDEQEFGEPDFGGEEVVLEDDDDSTTSDEDDLLASDDSDTMSEDYSDDPLLGTLDEAPFDEPGSATLSQHFHMARGHVGYEGHGDYIPRFPGLDDEIDRLEINLASAKGRRKKAQRALARYKEKHDLIAPLADRMSFAEMKRLNREAHERGEGMFVFPEKPREASGLVPAWERLVEAGIAKEIHRAMESLDRFSVEPPRPSKYQRDDRPGHVIYRQRIMKPYRMYEDARRTLPELKHKEGRIKRKLRKLRKRLAKAESRLAQRSPDDLETRAASISKAIAAARTDGVVGKDKTRFSRAVLRSLGVIGKAQEPAEIRAQGFWENQIRPVLMEMDSYISGKYEYSNYKVLPQEEEEEGEATDVGELRVDTSFEVGHRSFRRLSTKDWLDEHLINMFANIAMARQSLPPGERIQVHGTRVLEKMVRYERRARKGRKVVVRTRESAGSGVIEPEMQYESDDRYQAKHLRKLNELAKSTLYRDDSPNTHFFVVHTHGNHFVVFILRRVYSVERGVGGVWTPQWGIFDSLMSDRSGVKTRNRVSRIMALVQSTKWGRSRTLPVKPEAELVVDHQQRDGFSCGVFVCMFLAKKLLLTKGGMPGIRTAELRGFRRTIWRVLRHFRAAPSMPSRQDDEMSLLGDEDDEMSLLSDDD